MDKREFCSFLSKKIKRKVNITHITSIVNILCEEMSTLLKNEGEFEIHNFGTFHLKKTKPRKYFNVVKQQNSYSKGKYLLKFKVNRKFKKFLVSKIDLKKSIGD